MLRTALLGIALLVTSTGLICLLAGYSGAWPAVTIWGAVLVAAVVFERWRYRKPVEPEAGGWQETGEQFIDPETGQSMQVLYHPGTGERRYVSLP